MDNRKNFFKRINKNLKKNRFLDNLLYFISGKKWVYETFIFKLFLFGKKTSYSSCIDPVVIGGCPRSGTTLFRSLLGMHPNVSSPKKEYNILMYVKDKILLKEVFNFSDEEIYDIFEKSDNYICLAENILKLFQKKNQCKRYAVKHPHHIMIIDDIFNYFPRTKFIHVIRDGRDTVCSLRTHPKRKIENGEIINLKNRNPWKWCIRRWVASIRQGQKWRDSENYIEIKYENLVKNTFSTMEKIFDFLDLDPVEKKRIVDFYKYENDEKHPQNIEVGKSIYNKSVGRWKEDMPPKIKNVFKKMTDDLLYDLGYEKNKEW